MVNRSADLHTYLLEAASTPFAWRDHDCCSFAADWCVYSGHEDPMARWRESYEDEAGARLLFTDPGEFLSLWELGMIDAAIPECDEPRIGDVAVVLVRGEQGIEAVGGIFGGRRYHMLSPNGLYAASIDKSFVLKTWRV